MNEHVDLQVGEVRSGPGVVQFDDDLHDAGVLARGRVGADLILLLHLLADLLDVAGDVVLESRAAHGGVLADFDEADVALVNLGDGVHVVDAGEFEHAGLAHQFARPDQDFQHAARHGRANVGALQFGLDACQVGLGHLDPGLGQADRRPGGAAGRSLGVGFAAGSVGFLLTGQPLFAQLGAAHGLALGDVGVALDGDGDRVVMVDETGTLIDGDQLLYVLATARKDKGGLQGPVVATVMSNLGLEHALQARDIEFRRAAVGDRYVLEVLRDSGGVLGGETSGHMLVLDKATTGDGLISALQMAGEGVGGAAGGLCGGLFGGVVMIKLGINRALWVFGVVQVVSILGFALLSIIGHNLWMLGAANAFEYLGVGLGTAAFTAFIAKTTNPVFAATQFALFTAFTAVPRTLANAVTGVIVEQTGWTSFFLLCTVLAIPGMLLLLKVAPWNEEKI